MQPLKRGSQEQEAEGDPKPTWGAGALPKSSVPPPSRTDPRRPRHGWNGGRGIASTTTSISVITIPYAVCAV